MYKEKSKYENWLLKLKRIKKNKESTSKITQIHEHTPTFHKYYAFHINEYIVIIAGYMY